MKPLKRGGKVNLSIVRRCSVALLMATACSSAKGAEKEGPILRSRPHAPTLACSTGVHAMDPRVGNGLFVVPRGYSSDKPLPLIVALHGATGSAQGPLRWIGNLADSAGFIVLIPKSAGMTWDAIRGTYSVDAAMIDRELEFVFDRCSVDENRVALAGFSDGASYALGLGLQNPSLFTHVVAFSPGFITSGPTPRVGQRIFISHGTNDEILPIDYASRSIVPVLKSIGIKVEYHEFEGPHAVPDTIARAAVGFVLK